MGDPRVIVWFSCGAASAVAAKLTLAKYPAERVELAYSETGSEHPDNERFLKDVERWTGKTVTRLKNPNFEDTWDVWEKRRYLAGIGGAPCTVELKVVPRLAFQRLDDIHVFGYTADARDAQRADSLRENFPELTVDAPLIDRGITKAATLAMLDGAGIQVPVLYGLWFPNNNCIPCVKATSAAYWALVRKHFPAEFQRMVKLSRELGARLCRIDGERAFIDEIPADHPTTNPIAPSCDFLCHLAEQELEDA